MTNHHPNRSARMTRGRNPKPAEIAQLREEMQMTQTELGALLYRGRDIVAKWETGERRMPPDTWLLLCLRQAYPEVERAWRLWLEGRPF